MTDYISKELKLAEFLTHDLDDKKINRIRQNVHRAQIADFDYDRRVFIGASAASWPNNDNSLFFACYAPEPNVHKIYTDTKITLDLPDLWYKFNLTDGTIAFMLDPKHNSYNNAGKYSNSGNSSVKDFTSYYLDHHDEAAQKDFLMFAHTDDIPSHLAVAMSLTDIDNSDSAPQKTMNHLIDTLLVTVYQKIIYYLVHTPTHDLQTVMDKLNDEMKNYLFDGTNQDTNTWQFSIHSKHENVVKLLKLMYLKHTGKLNYADLPDTEVDVPTNFETKTIPELYDRIHRQMRTLASRYDSDRNMSRPITDEQLFMFAYLLSAYTQSTNKLLSVRTDLKNFIEILQADAIYGEFISSDDTALLREAEVALKNVIKQILMRSQKEEYLPFTLYAYDKDFTSQINSKHPVNVQISLTNDNLWTKEDAE